MLDLATALVALSALVLLGTMCAALYLDAYRDPAPHMQRHPTGTGPCFLADADLEMPWAENQCDDCGQGVTVRAGTLTEAAQTAAAWQGIHRCATEGTR